MANHLVLLKSDFFAHEQQAVAVADRYPQDVFAEHTHEFCELVLVWRGNGLHVLNDRPYRITRGDLFYIRAEDKHSYTSVNDLVLQNIIYCPERLTLNVDWQGAIPGFDGTPRHPHWRLGSVGMSQVRQVISQLEHESNQRDAQAFTMAELLFGQLVTHLKRHRYATDTLPATSSETLLDKLITALAGVCHAQYLLKHSRLMISEISMRCGFEDSNYFSVVFTRETGMTPSQWRHLAE
ncbi:MAG: AraC family ligand binding domain-containing protein [Citrobacter freundii]|nr:AraC family ligand binding domain-containing protein [Citrobacter freundii]